MFNAKAVSQDFLTTSGGENARSLLIRWNVSLVDFIQEVYDLIRPICDELPSMTRAYTAEKLCGKDAWDRWGVGQRRAAGMCIVYLAKNGALPLRQVSPEGVTPCRYTIR